MAGTIVELMRRRHSGRNKISLPSGYAQLDYIIGNNAIINAGVRATNPHTYECDVMFLWLNQRQITGGNGGNFFGINSTGKWQNGNAGDGDIGVQVNAHQWYHVSQYRPSGTTIITIDGTAYSANQTNVENDIFLFATSATGASTAMKYGAMKYFKIWIGDTLVRHFIPCVSPNDEVGMYDVVNKVFYTSINSNNFAGVTKEEPNSVTIVKGGTYINSNSGMSSSTGFYYTTPIQLNAGQTVVFQAYVGAANAAISIADNSGYVMQVQGAGSSVYRTYSYTAVDDVLLVFSGKIGETPPVITIDGQNITINGY